MAEEHDDQSKGYTLRRNPATTVQRGMQPARLQYVPKPRKAGAKITPPGAAPGDVLITRDLSLGGTESWELVREELVCVGSPSLVAAHRPDAMARWPMVASRSRPELLASWALATNLAPDSLHVVATYDHLFLALTAAIGGSGFLVVPRLFVLDQLRDGTLQLADERVVNSGASYVAYLNELSAHTQLAQDFCRWLKALLRDRK